MDPKKLLTEDSWRKVAPECKGKDKDLIKALSVYRGLAADDFDLGIKVLTRITSLASSLKSAREVTAESNAVKYLTALVGAAKARQDELERAKVEAEKVQLDAQKKAEQEEQDEDEDDDAEDDGQGDALSRLAKALQSLKSSKTPYHFLFCSTKPYGLVVAKRDISKSARHKTEVAQMAGGSSMPPRWGQCRRDGGALVFDMDKPLPGAARILQKWIKTNVGINTKVVVGGESADEGDESPEVDQPAGSETPPAAVAAPAAGLIKAVDVWRATQRSVIAGVEQLQAAVRKSLRGELPTLVQEVERNLTQLDGLGEMLGDDLPQYLKRAIDAADQAKRNSELKAAKTLLATYVRLVKEQGADLLAHIDSNPFGVKPELRKALTTGLAQVGQAILTPV